MPTSGCGPTAPRPAGCRRRGYRGRGGRAEAAPVRSSDLQSPSAGAPPPRYMRSGGSVNRRRRAPCSAPPGRAAGKAGRARTVGAVHTSVFTVGMSSPIRRSWWTAARRSGRRQTVDITPSSSADAGGRARTATRIRALSARPSSAIGQILDARHHVECLPAAVALAQERLAHDGRRTASRRCAPRAGRPAARR